MALTRRKVQISEFLSAMETGKRYEFTIYQATQGSFNELAKRNGIKGVRTKKLSPTRYVVWKEEEQS